MRETESTHLSLLRQEAADMLLKNIPAEGGNTSRAMLERIVHAAFDGGVEAHATRPASPRNSERASAIAQKVVADWSKECQGLPYTLSLAKLMNAIALEVEIALEDKDLKAGGKVNRG